MTNLHPHAQPERYIPLVAQAGRKLIELCHQKGVSIEDIEELSGISHSTLTAVRCGKTSPGIITYLRLCDVLGISLSDLFNCSTPVSQQLENL